MRVIVGVDRGDAARAALRYALREAHAHSAELHVVHAWESGFRAEYPTETVEQLRAAGAREATDLINEMLAEAGSQQRWANARVHVRPVEGAPAEALRIAASKDDLVVVGATHHRLLCRLIVGSVSDQVVREAHAPVVVVPARPRRRQASTCRPPISRRSAISQLSR